MAAEWSIELLGAGHERARFSGLEVDALDASASAFYQHYGFQAFRDHPLHLFLPLKTFERLF